VARQGKGMDPAAGSRQLDPVFAQTAFRLDFLTRPNAFSDMGFDFGKVRSGAALPSAHNCSAPPQVMRASGACSSMSCWLHTLAGVTSERPCQHLRAARGVARTRMTAMRTPKSGVRLPAELSAQVSVAERAQPSDERFVCAYPHFNVNGACTSIQDVCVNSMELGSSARHVHAHNLRRRDSKSQSFPGWIDILFHAGTA